MSRRSWQAISLGLAFPPADLLTCPPSVALVALAESVESIGADLPGPMREAYLDVVCPERHAFPSREADWYTMSGCALVARSHLRRLGWRSARLGLLASGERVAYQIGRAVTNVVEEARARGAWRTGSVPDIGAIVLIGTGSQEHVLTMSPPTTDLPIDSVDGGQTIGGYQAILRRSRKVAPLHGTIDWEGRPQQGWIAVDSVAPDVAPEWGLI